MILEQTTSRLKALAASGIRPVLWLRDDDFCRMTPKFQLLCAVLELDVPLLISAVPFRLRLLPQDKLWLARAPRHLMFCTHGYNHAAHGNGSGGVSEYPDGRDMGDVRKELEFGVARLTEEFAERALPVFVPPWNYIDAAYLPILKELGVRIVSGAKSRAQPVIEGLGTLHVDIDVLTYDTGPPYSMKRADVLDREFLQVIDNWDADKPVLGVLSHHTGMTEADITIYIAMIRELSAYCDALRLRALPRQSDGTERWQ